MCIRDRLYSDFSLAITISQSDKFVRTSQCNDELHYLLCATALQTIHTHSWGILNLISQVKGTSVYKCTQEWVNEMKFEIVFVISYYCSLVFHTVVSYSRFIYIWTFSFHIQWVHLQMNIFFCCWWYRIHDINLTCTFSRPCMVLILKSKFKFPQNNLAAATWNRESVITFSFFLLIT